MIRWYGLAAIKRHLERIEKTMSTRDQLDAGIAQLKSDIADAGTRISQKIADLEAKINAGGDFSAELADLNAEADAVTALGQDQPAPPAPGP